MKYVSLFKMVPLLAIMSESSGQQTQSFRLDHLQNGARVYASINGAEDGGANDALIRQLRAGDVGGLKPLCELAAPGLRSIPLPTVSSVYLDTPGRVRIVRDAVTTHLELKTFSTETMTKAPLTVSLGDGTVTVRPPGPTHLCAMSLVDERLVSLIGTCTEATVFIAPGDHVRVYVEGALR